MSWVVLDPERLHERGVAELIHELNRLLVGGNVALILQVDPELCCSFGNFQVSVKSILILQGDHCGQQLHFLGFIF